MPERASPPLPPLIVPLLVSVVIVPEFDDPRAARAAAAHEAGAAGPAGDRPAVGQRRDRPGVRRSPRRPRRR